MGIWVPLHAGYVGRDSLVLLGALTLAAIGTALLLGLALAAFVRRRSQPYLLIVTAVVALFGRSMIGGLMVVGMIRPDLHHLLEHGLDVVLVALVIAAIYYARTVTKERKSNL